MYIYSIASAYFKEDRIIDFGVNFKEKKESVQHL